MNKMANSMLALLMLATVTLAAGCGEKDVKPSLVGSWQLEGFGLTSGDFLHLVSAPCSVTIYDGGYGVGIGFMNEIRYEFRHDGGIHVYCTTKVYAEGRNAQLFYDCLPEMNRYELKQNELKLFSADSTNKYLLYHRLR